MDRSALWYQVALTKIPKIGPQLARRLVSYCGSPEAIFKQKKSALNTIPGIGKVLANTISSAGFANKVDEQMTQLIKHKDVEVLFYLNDNYPNRLKHFADSPIVLYKKGSGNIDAARTIGIVGTRKPTQRGTMLCEKLIEELLPQNVCVISGLAYGIDIAAHRKAYNSGLSTIAVLGSGVNNIYPKMHTSLAKKIQNEGAILSEFGLSAKPDKKNFPKRNRIIAGLSDALVVVESPALGGSLITVEYAENYNKDVFAFPGRPGDEKSAGCNALIKNNKAALIESAQDIVAFMNWDLDFRAKPIQQTLLPLLSTEEKVIYDLINEEGQMDIDKLTYTSKIKRSTLISLLLNLEFHGLIKPIPGNLYIVI